MMKKKIPALDLVAVFLGLVACFGSVTVQATTEVDINPSLLRRSTPLVSELNLNTQQKIAKTLTMTDVAAAAAAASSSSTKNVPNPNQAKKKKLQQTIENNNNNNNKTIKKTKQKQRRLNTKPSSGRSIHTGGRVKPQDLTTVLLEQELFSSSSNNNNNNNNILETTELDDLKELYDHLLLLFAEDKNDGHPMYEFDDYQLTSEHLQQQRHHSYNNSNKKKALNPRHHERGRQRQEILRRRRLIRNSLLPLQQQQQQQQQNNNDPRKEEEENKRQLQLQQQQHSNTEKIKAKPAAPSTKPDRGTTSMQYHERRPNDFSSVSISNLDKTTNRDKLAFYEKLGKPLASNHNNKNKETSKHVHPKDPPVPNLASAPSFDKTSERYQATLDRAKTRSSADIVKRDHTFVDLGVPIAGLAGLQDESFYFQISADLNPGETVFCVTRGNNTDDADLFLSFDDFPFAEDATDVDFSESALTSNEFVTTTNDMQRSISVFGEIFGFCPYSEVELLCDLGPFQELESEIVSDVAVEPLNFFSDESQYFYLTATIDTGETLTCTLFGDNGDADLYIYNEATEDTLCESENDGSNEICVIEAMEDNTSIEIEVYSSSAFSNVKLLCTLGLPVAASLAFVSDGVPITDLAAVQGEGVFLQYTGSTLEGEYITCISKGPGDAALSGVWDGDVSMPACTSSNDISSAEVCIAEVPAGVSALNLLVFAFADFSMVEVECETSTTEPPDVTRLEDGRKEEVDAVLQGSPAHFALPDVPVGVEGYCEAFYTETNAPFTFEVSFEGIPGVDSGITLEDCETVEPGYILCELTAPSDFSTAYATLSATTSIILDMVVECFLYPDIEALEPSVPALISLEEAESSYFEVTTTVEPGEFITCRTSASSADVDLFVAFFDLPFFLEPSLRCSSESFSSNELCFVYNNETEAQTVYLEVFAAVCDVDDIDVECVLGFDASLTDLSLGVTLSGQAAEDDESLYYQVISELSEGDLIVCVSFGGTGDADLALAFNGFPFGGGLTVKESFFDGNFEYTEVTIPSDDTQLTAELFGFAPFTDASIQCYADTIEIQELVLGTPVLDLTQEAPKFLRYEVTSELSQGDVIKCYTTGGTGDVDLFVGLNGRLGTAFDDENPSEITASTSVGNEESVTVSIASSTDSIFVELFALESFQGVKLECTIVQPTSLELGVALPGLSGAEDESSLYSISSDNLSEGKYVTCTTTGGTGDVDLTVYFNNLLFTACESSFGSNEESCTVLIPNDATTLVVELLAFEEYSGVTLKCDEISSVSFGFPVSDLSAPEDQFLFFEIAPELNFYAGDEVECNTTGGTGDVDITLTFNGLDIPDDSFEYGCFGFNFGNEESCLVTVPEDGTTLFIELEAFETFKSVDLSCELLNRPLPSTDPSAPTELIYGDSVFISLAAASTVFFFKYTAGSMTTFLPDEFVTCTLRGPDGDASFGIRLNDQFGDLICVSDNPGTSNEDCIAISSAGSIDAAFVQVEAGEIEFSNLVLICEFDSFPAPAAPTPAPPLPQIPPPPDNGSGCFSEETLVDEQTRGLVAMKDLSIGDQVWTGAAYETVYGFGNYHQMASTTFVQIFYSRNNNNSNNNRNGTSVSVMEDKPLEMTANHLVYIEGKGHPIQAGSVRVNDKLVSANKEEAGLIVTRIASVTRGGVYAPFTASGQLVVDRRIKASAYVSLQDSSSEYIALGEVDVPWLPQHSLCHMWMAPYRLYCQHWNTDCLGETYDSASGRSAWVHFGKEFVAWGEAQPLMVQGLVLLAVCAVLLLAVGLECLLAWNPVTMTALLVMLMGGAKVMSK